MWQITWTAKKIHNDKQSQYDEDSPQNDKTNSEYRPSAIQRTAYAVSPLPSDLCVKAIFPSEKGRYK
jgi:hypothetical protein